MSLIQWVPGEHHKYAGQMEGFRDEDVDGYEFVEEWFGEDGYAPGPLFWLQLFENDEGGQKAILRSYIGGDVNKVMEEHEEDAVGFLKWDGYRTEFVESEEKHVIMYPVESNG